MASRRFKQFRYSLETAVTDIFARVSIGASGAPTLVSSATCQGILSISRSSAGKYVLTLTDPYVRVLGINVVTQLSSGLPASADVAVVTDAVSTATAPAVTFTMSAAGVATDPSNGSILLIQLILKNSSIQ